MKIATWNVNSLNVRLPHVLRWLTESQVDVLCLQELKLAPEKFPIDDFTSLGYHVVWNGQKTYNGVAIISKLPITDVVYDLPDFADEQKRVIAATIAGIRFINVYCVNGEAIGSEKFAYKTAWFAQLNQYVKESLASFQQLVLLGDFNIAPADIDVYNPESWFEKVLCSSEERSWFQALLDLGLSDSLRQLNPEQELFTWWDYRMNGFKRNLGMRIDHILLSAALMSKTTAYGIAKDARAWDRPSDHAAVWVEIED